MTLATVDPSLDIAAIRSFIEAWFRACPAGHLVEVRPLNKRPGQRPQPRTWFAKVDDAVRYVESSAKRGDDVYIGALPRKKRGGTAEDVGSFRWVWADVDYGTVGHAVPAAHATRGDALRVISSLPVQPTTVVDTGGGFHVWWLLSSEPTAPDWSDAIERVVHATQGDVGAKDPPRILRVPGTLNFKVSPARAVSVAAGTGVAVDIDAFRSLPTRQTSLPEATSRAPVQRVGDRPFERANDVPIYDVMQWLGVPLHREGGRVYGPCPVHGGSNIHQMIVGGDSNVATCFSGDCNGAVYTPVDVVAHYHNVEPKEAVNLLARRFNFEGFPEKRSKRPASNVVPLRQPDDDQNTPEWHASLSRTKDGSAYKATLANVMTILTRDERWRGVIAYNAFRDAEMARRPPPCRSQDCPPVRLVDAEWKHADTIRTVAWLHDEFRIDVSTGMVDEAVHAVAEKNAYHPVCEYLSSLEWDGVERHLFTSYFGAFDSLYTREVSRRWLISAVARVFEPGCKVDHTPVLEGDQGGGKSSAARALCKDESWFFDSDLPIGDKDAYQNLQGKWIVELAELGSLTNAEIRKVKQFLTEQTPTFRGSYGKRASTKARQCVFMGTTNEGEYLRDRTGNRRFWPVRIGRIDLQSLRRDRDQIWAEAVARYRRHEPWHVDNAELARLCSEEQAARLQGDAWEDFIVEWLANPTRKTFDPMGRVHVEPFDLSDGVTSAEVLRHALDKSPGHVTKGDEMRVGEVLRSLGWEKGEQRREGGKRVRRFTRVAEVDRSSVTTPIADDRGDASGDDGGDTSNIADLLDE